MNAAFRASSNDVFHWGNEGLRYTFNGKETDSETGLYDYGARMYDSRLGRWLKREPHAKKYAFMSPYCYVANTPLVAIDPDGKDIIVLSAPDGAGGLGHMAMLVGNERDGWYLYSKNGTRPVPSSGASNNNPENGIYFQSLTEFANSSSNFDENGNQEYQSAYQIVTTTDQDILAKTAAAEQVETWYDVTNTFSGNCATVVTASLAAAGLNTAEEVDPAYPPIIPGEGYILGWLIDDGSPNFMYNNFINANPGIDMSDKLVPFDWAGGKVMAERANAKQAENGPPVLEPDSEEQKELNGDNLVLPEPQNVNTRTPPKE